MEVPDSLLSICNSFEQGKCGREEYKGMLEALLLENIVQNRYVVLEEVDAILLKFLPYYHSNNDAKNIFDATINVIKDLQNSSYAEVRDFFTKGYKNLLILCRRYQSGEFDVFDFRERLGTVTLPENPGYEIIAKIYTDARYRLDDIEYLEGIQEANEIGKIMADKIVTSITGGK